MSRGRSVVLLCALSLVGVAVLGTAVGTAPTPAGDLLLGESIGEAGVGATASPLEPKQIVLSFHVGANGTAAASVAYWIQLDDQTSITAFERVQEEVRANRSKYTERFDRRIRATVQNAEQTTGRQMATENVTVRAYRGPQKYGIVKYTYRWNGFGETREDELIVGPALGGLHLGEETRLFISWPADYRVKTVASTVSERRAQSAIWEGPMTFDRGGPRVVLERDRGVTMEFLWGSQSVLPIHGSRLIPVAGMAAFLIGTGAIALRRRQTGTGVGLWPGLLAAITIGGGRSEEADETVADGEGRDVLDGETDEPPELMSDRESLLWELEQRGGRAKQKELVDALGWSDAKGSRLISKLRENDEVETFRLGNENVLTLPDERGLLGGDGGDGNEGGQDA